MGKTLCLTIDDAPSETFLDKLDVLDRYGICAIWFCQGNLMEQRPNAVREAISRGHVIGNHSYTHASFEELTVDQGVAEITATDAIIDKLHDEAGRPRRYRYFRFPYGNKGNGPPSSPRNEPELLAKYRAYQECLRSLGYTALPSADPTGDVHWEWTFSTNDWSPFYPDVALPDFTAPEQVLVATRDWSTAADEARTEIIIMHDTPGQRAHQLFCDLVAELAGKGLPFIGA
ncbi:MAG: polysaccharide deacetylase family protein [Anaerolineae bacterium]